ncbi:MAG: molybdopterin-dependent oxidoreductase [Coriobacteriales bacterium]|nr:molybdopterin-dependent oxidoreductase [Coriobacteriales bacterium]
MSGLVENVEKSPGLTRRSFLKTTAAIAGTAALGSALGCTGSDNKKMTDVEEKVVRQKCGWTCVQCQYEVVVRDGHVVMARPLEGGDLHGARMCLRGRAQMQRLYSPERIKYPMKRRDGSERGAGEWERISWDEAISLLVEKWKSYAEEYGNTALCWYHGSGNATTYNGLLGMMPRLANVLQMTDAEYCTDMALIYAFQRTVGGSSYVSSETADIVNSKAIIVWGANVADADFPNWRYVADAIEQGVKLICVNPNFNSTVAKCDIWYAPYPGTDVAILMGMMNYIVNNNLHDEEFLLTHTVAPVLIHPQKGCYLRMSDCGIPPIEGPISATTGKPEVLDPPAVWDKATESPMALGESVNPALSGTFTAGGLKCRTAFDHLVDEVNTYPPEKAAEISGLKPEDIIELGEIAANGPIWNYTQYGPQAHVNGVHQGHAQICLAALTGNAAKHGANTTPPAFVFPGNFAVQFPSMTFKTTVPVLELPNILETGTYAGKPFPIKSLHVTFANPFTGLPDTNKLKTEVFDKIEFISVVEIQMTETARYADLVLPVTHCYEVDDVVSLTSYPGMDIMEKAVEPLYEAKSDAEIVKLIAKGMGVGEHFEITMEEFFRQHIDESPLAQTLNITYDRLKKEKQILYGTTPYIAAENGEFGTSTKRMEFYVDQPTPRIDYGQDIDMERERLPHYFEPAEVGRNSPLAEKYPLVLQSERLRTRWHCNGFLQPWTLEISPEPIIKLNPSDATVRGIQDGDYVKVYNDRGFAVAKANYSEGIRQGIAVYPKGWNSFEHKAGGWSQLLTWDFDPAGVNASFMDNRAEVVVWDGKEG